MSPVRLFAVLLVTGALAVAGIMLWALNGMPALNSVARLAEPSLLLETSDGEMLARKGPLKMADAQREDFPDHLVDAVLSIEDRRFYSHWGIDFRGTARALHRNLRAGEIVQGGSTITQQLVKILVLDNERTFDRKLREAAMAVWLETRLEKDEILTRYLNNVYLGGGAYGMRAAARLYFDKDLHELTLSESAMLAGLIKAPSHLNPLRDLEAARSRAAVVLSAMVENGVIDENMAEEAKAEPLVLDQTRPPSQESNWFADWAAEEALGLADSFTEGVRVRTTLVPALQDLAERVVDDALSDGGENRGASEAALVALRPDGAVVAMVGGRDYGESQFNRAVQAKRQPGSTFKLFVYLAALRNGLSLDDTVEDSPIEIDGWRPDNFGGDHYGRVTLAEAFTRSLNTAAVRLALEVGLDEVIEAARDLGIDAEMPENPSLALGTTEVSLLDLTGAYASVRAGSAPVEPWGIAAFGPEEEGQLYSTGAPVIARQSLEPYQAELVALLRSVVERGTGRAAQLDGFSAGKTGTSQNFRDAWFIGFNESLVVGVWVGNDDGTPMDEVTGGSLPASIWKSFMTEAESLMPRHRVPRLDDTPDLLEEDEPELVAEAAPSGSISLEDFLAQRRDGIRPIRPGRDRDVDLSSRRPERALCDVEACASAYRSFRASDCTYQPYSGPRRLCERGSPPEIADAPLAAPDGFDSPFVDGVPDQPPQMVEAPGMAEGLDDTFAEAAFEGDFDEPPTTGSIPAQPAGQPQQGMCNVAACAAEYRSFRASDCTYQPYSGPRRLCER